MTIIPAVDEYSEIRARSRELIDLRATHQSRKVRLDDWTGRVAVLRETLNRRQSGMIRAGEIGKFRDHLVEMIRETDCQLRQLQVGDAETRRWMIGDHPLQSRQTIDEMESTPYEVTTYHMTMTVVGDFGSLIALLTRLEGSEKHFFTRQLSLSPDHINRNEIILELGLVLFGFRESIENAGNESGP